MAWWWDDGPGGCRNAGNGEGDNLDTSCPLLDAGRVKSTKCNYMDNLIIYWLWKWIDIRKEHILVEILVSPVMTLRQWDTKSQYQLLYNLSQTRQSPRWQPHHWLAYRPRTLELEVSTTHLTSTVSVAAPSSGVRASAVTIHHDYRGSESLHSHLLLQWAVVISTLDTLSWQSVNQHWVELSMKCMET